MYCLIHLGHLHGHEMVETTNGQNMTQKFRKKRLSALLVRLGWILGLLAMFAVILVPIFIMVKYSISDRASIIVPPGTPIPFWPYKPTFEIFKHLLGTKAFMESAMMSLSIALITVGFSLVLGTPAAFALVRYHIPGKLILLILLISMRFFPDVAASIPITEIFLKVGLTNVLGVSLVHTLLALPYMIYIAMGVFETIPRELEEQAHILGASRLYAFIHVIVPVALPGLAAGAIYAFLLSWNEFIFAYFLLFISTVQTLPVHLKTILAYSPQHNVLAAISVMVSIPVMIFTLCIQKYMRTGAMAGAVK